MGGVLSITEEGKLRLGCPYFRFGCDILGLDRKQLKKHKQEYLERHLDLISTKMEEQSFRITELEVQNRQLRVRNRSALTRIGDVIDYLQDYDEEIRENSSQKQIIAKNERKIVNLEERLNSNDKNYELNNQMIVGKLIEIFKSVEENNVTVSENGFQNDRMKLVEKEIRHIKEDCEVMEERIQVQSKRLNSQFDMIEDGIWLRNPKRIKREM